MRHETFNLILSVVLIVLMIWNSALFIALVAASKKVRDRKKLSDYVLHLELFSMMYGKIIVPDGESPDDKSETKRFQNWRMN